MKTEKTKKMSLRSRIQIIAITFMVWFTISLGIRLDIQFTHNSIHMALNNIHILNYLIAIPFILYLALEIGYKIKYGRFV